MESRTMERHAAMVSSSLPIRDQLVQSLQPLESLAAEQGLRCAEAVLAAILAFVQAWPDEVVPSADAASTVVPLFPEALTAA